MNNIKESLPEEWSHAAQVNFRRGRKKRILEELSWDDFPDEGTRWIAIRPGVCTTVDEDDYDFLMQWNWTLNNWGYAIRRIKGMSISMHRVIINCPDGMQVDHINHRQLDNRRSNLRICTVQQNAFNSLKWNRSTSSGYKGVSFCRGRSGKRWCAYSRLNGKTKNLGRYENEEDAAKAYDEWARSNYGEFASLNFP